MAISKIGSKALVDCSVASADLEDGSITNAKLANSSITVNGTSVSLGASASLVDISWQSVITASGGSNTAVAGEGYFIDTTSAAHTITLPSSPSIGDKIAIKDYAGTFATNNLTIGRNGNNIQGVANDSQISTNRASIILVYSDATKGWLYTVESNVADLIEPVFITATGGTITTSGDYKIHTFTGDGCFVVSCGGTPTGSNSVDYLVVAGGGGSGARHGGGGGAGGFRESHSTPVSGCYTASPLATPIALPVSATTYPITVGAGGTAGCFTIPLKTSGGIGANSVFSTITSAGGGGGVTAGQTSATITADGGSGGGGALCGLNNTPRSPNQAAGVGNTPPVSPPQGNNGGTGQVAAPYNAGGGGGATATGGNGAPTTGGNGGAGGTTHITGSPVAYAGGGGGGGYVDCGGVGGTGGGGDGGDNNTQGIAGTANTGGGAGGTGNMQTGSPPSGTPQVGAAGGKGIVIIRYKFQ